MDLGIVVSGLLRRSKRCPGEKFLVGRDGLSRNALLVRTSGKVLRVAPQLMPTSIAP